MKNKRILLLYTTDHSGHYRASTAIETALKVKHQNVETLNINFFQYSSALLEKVVDKTYLGLIKKKPEIWKYLYDNPKIVKKTQKVKEFINEISTKKLDKLINDFEPDCICCTQAYPCGVVANFKKKFSANIPLIGVLTDYVAHSYWIYNHVDHYVVPSSEIKDKLIHAGIDSEKIKIYGIPVDPRFSETLDSDGVIKEFGLDENIPVILIMGGGHGLGPINKILDSIIENEINAQILVVAGKNKKLFGKVERQYKNKYNNVRLLSYVHNIETLMEISELVITKPGGLTTSEALVKSLPMILVNPIPGQEMKNAEYLVNTGAALKCDDISQIGGLVAKLFNSEKYLHSMRQSARQICMPDSAIRTAELLLNV